MTARAAHLQWRQEELSSPSLEVCKWDTEEWNLVAELDLIIQTKFWWELMAPRVLVTPAGQTLSSKSSSVCILDK